MKTRVFLKYFFHSSSIVEALNHTKCVSLGIQKCMTEPTLINLHLNEKCQKLYYYPFAVNPDRCDGIYNTLDDLCNKACAPNEAEDLKLCVFNMITGIYNINRNINNEYIMQM